MVNTFLIIFIFCTELLLTQAACIKLIITKKCNKGNTIKTADNITIETPAYGGHGIGYINGKVVFVKNAVPGDRVSINITEEKKDFSFAEINAIMDPSPDRTAPPCENFGTCGGCAYLNVDYNTELTYKQQIVYNALRKIAHAGIALPDIDTVSSDRYNYRSHATIKCRDSRAGFFKQGTIEHIPFNAAGCMLLHEKLNRYIQKTAFRSNEVRIAIDAEENILASTGNNGFLTEVEQGMTYRRSIDSFFQVNRFLRKKMIQNVIELAQVHEKETVMDIGCGVGFFTLQLARLSDMAYGFDISRDSIMWAGQNAELNSISNARFMTLPDAQIHPGRYSPDLIVVDPPRAGLSRKARNTIKTIKPERFIYVSCNPSTFSRDAFDFLMSGFSMESMIYIDMFPCTHHIELITLFRSDI